MKYLDELRKFIKVLVQSRKFSLLCIAGPPGWGKSHSTRETLNSLGIDYQNLGSYSTPLALYNFLADHSSEFILLDDTAGIFHNPQALSILNAAAWPGGAKCGKRIVKWTSTSDLVREEEFEFTGKLIVLTNFIPNTPQARAFANRSLYSRIEIPSNKIGPTLLCAAQSEIFFANPKLAQEVALYLGEYANSEATYNQETNISLRTLELGVELATIEPKSWKEMLAKSLRDLSPLQDETSVKNNMSSVEIVNRLQASGMNVEAQSREFQALTGRSRRAFFYAKKKAMASDLSLN